MKRSFILAVIAGASLLCGAAFLIVGPSPVSPDAIQSSANPIVRQFIQGDIEPVGRAAGVSAGGRM